LLGELEGDGGVLICDLEAGVGTVLRMEPGYTDVVLVVADSSAKSIEVARRAAAIAAGRQAKVVVIANRVREGADVEAIRAAVPDHELVVVPEDATITRADREGLAPIDLDPEAPGVSALRSLADRLTSTNGL
jgi:CO dehydrogenase nickel-insertion accessory protein CooC1